MKKSAVLSAIASFLAACASAPPPVSTTSTPPPPATSSPPVVASAPTPAPPASSAAFDEPKVAPPPPAVAEVDLGAFARVLDEPVRSLALGEPRVAALAAEDAFLFERGKWVKLTFPGRLRPGPNDVARIFFGRDDRPRVMGIRERDGRPSQLYLRWRNDKWNDERGEIAKLREPPPEGLWGVLGHADPEVVCKVGDDCIVKRRTGWKMMPAGPGAPRVELHAGIAYALRPDGVYRVEQDKRWVPIASSFPFHDPGGVFAVGDEAWVSEPRTGRVHHLRAGAWTSEEAAVAEPRGLWGSAVGDVWLAGASGLAHWDGAKWSKVRGPSGPLAEVFGRGGEIWASGKSGVWMRAGSSAPAH